MDDTDLRILELLQENNRTPSEKIAADVCLSPSAVQRRIKRLRDEGVILHDTSVVSPEAIGRSLTCIVEVTLERGPARGLEEFSREVSDLPEVTQVYLVTGKADFVLIVSARTMDEYEAFTRRLFVDNPKVARFETSVVLQRVKVGLRLPILDGAATSPGSVSGDAGADGGIHPHEGSAMNAEPPPDVDALVANRHWLEALARGLMPVGGYADDAVQETLLIALERPPRDPRAIRTWLGRVLRSRAREHSRSEARRRRREQRVARPEALPSDAELHERLETQRRVTEIVSALSEPHRRTLLLRYFEELTPQEIATRLGVPPSTVRSRIQRAHEELRRRLDEEFRSRRAWSVALLPFATRWEGPMATAAGTAGAWAVAGWTVFMKKHLTVVGVLLVVLASSLIWIQNPWVKKPREHSASGTRIALESDPEEGKGDAGPVPLEGPRPGLGAAATPTDLEIAAAPEGTPAPPPETNPMATVKGRIWRRDGESLDGSRVFLWGGKQPGARVDEAGEFVIECPYEMSTHLYLEYEGARIALNAPVRPRFDEEVFLEVELEVGHEVEIRVLEQATGRSVPEAPLVIRRSFSRGQAASIFTQTDERGGRICPFLPEGEYQIEIQHPDFTYLQEPFRVPTDGSLVFELKEPRPLEIILKGYAEYPAQSRVYVDLNRIPAPGERGQHLTIVGEPDADGRFRGNAPEPGRWRYDMFGAADFPRARGELHVLGGDRTIRMEIELPDRGRVTVAGSLTDAEGRAVGPGRISFWPAQGAVGPGGAFIVEDVWSGRNDVAYRTGRPNHEIVYPLGTFEIPEVSEFELDLTLRGTAELSTWVEGLPPDLRAELVVAIVEKFAGEQNFWGVLGAHERFTFRYLPPGTYRVRFLIGGRSLAPQEIELGPEAAELPFSFPGVARVALTVRAPDGSELPPRGVVILPLDGPDRRQTVSLTDQIVKLEFLRTIEATATLEIAGYEPSSFDLVAIPGEEREAFITLEPSR